MNARYADEFGLFTKDERERIKFACQKNRDYARLVTRFPCGLA